MFSAYMTEMDYQGQDMEGTILLEGDSQILKAFKFSLVCFLVYLAFYTTWLAGGRLPEMLRESTMGVGSPMEFEKTQLISCFWGLSEDIAELAFSFFTHTDKE